MNKILKTSTFLLLLFTSRIIYCQDIITKKIVGKIIAKVIEVSKTEIKYKKFDNLNGPIFIIDIADVSEITYENGSKDEFNISGESPFKIKKDENMTEKGIVDANINYSAINSGKGWTAATTILFSPLIGIIPAVACASSRPKDANLNYRDRDLLKDNNYNIAYTSEASKIKKKRVWRSFGISSVVWVALYVIFPAPKQ
jgi:hypothetical protein